jgi:hypothetical protein
MTDTTVREPTPAELKAMKRYVRRIGDIHLYRFADPFTDRNGNGFPLILHVSGTIISGKACSAKEWAEALQRTQAEADRDQRIQNGEPDDTPGLNVIWGMMAKTFGEIAEAQEAAWEADDATLTDDQIKERWRANPQIHLLDSKVFVSGTTINQGPCRIQLKAVDAWTIGTMSTP